MNCEWYEEQISAFVDHEIDDQQGAAVFMHLGTCSSCRIFLASLQKIRSTIPVTLEEVPASLDARVRAIPGRELKKGDLASIVQRTAAWWKHRLAIPAPAFAVLILMLLMSAAMIFELLRTPHSYTDTQSSPVVYIMSLSPIEVQAQRIDESPRVQ
jgi:anti-sigma factor RsiW